MAKKAAKREKADRTAKPSKPELPLEEEQLPSSDEEFEGFASTDEEFEGFNSTSESEVEVEDNDREGSKKTKDNSATKEDVAKLAKAANEKNSKGNKSYNGNKDDNARGVVYVGRIPHGFYEDQMREYFGQFGTITRLRLSRNKRTGASKHYGFVEFATAQVADVVCDTMDNYLLFGHILKVKRIDPAQIHESLWVGANRKYQAIPWGRVMKQRYDRRKSREWWEEYAAKDAERRRAKNDRLKALGIDYSY